MVDKYNQAPALILQRVVDADVMTGCIEISSSLPHPHKNLRVDVNRPGHPAVETIQGWGGDPDEKDKGRVGEAQQPLMKDCFRDRSWSFYQGVSSYTRTEENVV